MVKRHVSWEFLFMAFIITATLLTGVFFIGMELSDQKISELQKQLEESTVTRHSQDISRQLAEELPEKNCAALQKASKQTLEKVQELQKDVATYEQTHKIESVSFLRLKKQYTNLLLEHWLTTKRLEQSCGKSLVQVLYLYDDPENCERCPDQGTILTYYLQEYPDRLIVFPLDTTLNMQPVNLVQDVYNITQYPTLVVEGTAYTGFKNREELGELLAPHLAAANKTQP